MEWPWPRADPYVARTSAVTSPALLGWYTAKGLPPGSHEPARKIAAAEFDFSSNSAGDSC